MARDKKLKKSEVQRLVDLAMWIDWAIWSEDPAIRQRDDEYWGRLMLALSESLWEVWRRNGYVRPLVERAARAAIAADVDTSSMGEDERAWAVARVRQLQRWHNYEPSWWPWVEH